MTSLLPDSVDGWSAAGGTDQFYGRENLYDYINGGAELYLSYDFQQLITRTYQKTGQPNIIVDLFDMGHSHNAYGVFSHAREKYEQDFGQGSQYTAGSLLFWKDQYFISILSSPETRQSKEAIHELAGSISEAIPREGTIPPVVSILPRDALIRESVKYFTHPIWLNSYYFISDRNIFHISNETDAVLAKYSQGNIQRSIVLLIQYPEHTLAKQAFRDFVSYNFPDANQDMVIRMEDNSWSGAGIEGRAIFAVFDAGSRETAVHLLDLIKLNIDQ